MQGPRLMGMARPQVADGGHGLQIWRVAANILSRDRVTILDLVTTYTLDS
jgi:hypothetical protein